MDLKFLIFSFSQHIHILLLWKKEKNAYPYFPYHFIYLYHVPSILILISNLFTLSLWTVKIFSVLHCLLWIQNYIHSELRQRMPANLCILCLFQIGQLVRLLLSEYPVMHELKTCCTPPSQKVKQTWFPVLPTHPSICPHVYIVFSSAKLSRQ